MNMNTITIYTAVDHSIPVTNDCIYKVRPGN